MEDGVQEMSMTATHFKPKRKRKNKGSVSPKQQTIDHKYRSGYSLKMNDQASNSTVSFTQALPFISEGDKSSKLANQHVFRRN